MMKFKYIDSEEHVLDKTHVKSQLDNNGWFSWEPINIEYLGYSGYFAIECSEKEEIISNNLFVYQDTFFGDSSSLAENNDGTYFSLIGSNEKFRIFNKNLSANAIGNKRYFIACLIKYKDENGIEKEVYLCHSMFLKIIGSDGVSHLYRTLKVDSYYRPFFFNAALLLLPQKTDIIYLRKTQTTVGNDDETIDLYDVVKKDGNGYISIAEDEEYSVNNCRFYCSISNGCSIRNTEDKKYYIGDATLNISQGMDRKVIKFTNLYRLESEILKPKSIENQTIYDSQEIRIANCYGNDIQYLSESDYKYDFATESSHDTNVKIIYPTKKKITSTSATAEPIEIDTSNLSGISVRFSVKEGTPSGMEEFANEIESYYNGVKFYDFIGHVVNNNSITSSIRTYGTTSNKCRYFLCDERDLKNILLSLNGNVINDSFITSRIGVAYDNNDFYGTHKNQTTCGINNRELYFNEDKLNSSWYGPLTHKEEDDAGNGYWALFRNEITAKLKEGTYSNSSGSHQYVIGICDPYTELEDDVLKSEFNNRWGNIYKHTSRLSIVKIYIIK